MVLKTNWLFTILFSVACVSTAQSQLVNTPQGWSGQQVAGQDRIGSWRQGFNGRSWISWDGNHRDVWWLWVTVRQNSGGFDAGVGWNVATGTKANQIWHLQTMNYNFTTNATGSGDWWMGPKTLIYYRDKWDNDVELAGQYECYVIENSNRSPTHFKQLYESFGETFVKRFSKKYSGVWYDHYVATLGQTNQIWCFRRSYRSSGVVPIGLFRDDWMRRNMVPGDWYDLGWRINVETAHQVNGEFGFTNLYLPPNDPAYRPY